MTLMSKDIRVILVCDKIKLGAFDYVVTHIVPVLTITSPPERPSPPQPHIGPSLMQFPGRGESAKDKGMMPHNGSHSHTHTHPHTETHTHISTLTPSQYTYKLTNNTSWGDHF